MTNAILTLALAAALQAPAPGIAFSNTVPPVVTTPVVLPPQSLPPAAIAAPRIVAGPQPVLPIGHYISPLDYPADAHGAEGKVGFQLTIDSAGHVVGCSVTRSSGSRVLDGATCRILMRRARYTPAHDSNGNLAFDTADGEVVWKAPPAR